MEIAAIVHAWVTDNYDGVVVVRFWGYDNTLIADGFVLP